jgi:hypothetical protein
LKLTQLRKLFRIAPCKAWVFLEHEKASFMNFPVWAEFEIWKRIDLAWGSLVSGAFTFLPCRPMPGPTPPHPQHSRSPRGHRTHGGVAPLRLWPPFAATPRGLISLISARGWAVEKHPPFSPLMLILPLPPHSAFTLMLAALRAISSHRRATSVLSVRAIRSSLTLCTFCTEFLHGAPATEASQRSSLRRHLAPHELTANCHAASSSGCALTSRRSPGVSWSTSATPSPPMTSCPSHHCLPPRCRELHPCAPPLVSVLPSHAPDPTHRHVL